MCNQIGFIVDAMNVDKLQQMYEELAQRHERQREARQRDIFLVLAADAALAAGRGDEAERLRKRLLQLSPHSMLRPYASFEEAMQSSDIQDYVGDLRKLFPPSQTAKLLHGGNGKNGADESATPIFRFQEPEAPRVAAAAPKPVAPKPVREKTPSPYEWTDVPLPPGRGFDAWGSWVAMLIYFLVFAAAVSLGAYIMVRPFLF